MVVYQTNRKGKNGKILPNNVAVFVEYNNNGTEGIAVIEFDSSIDPESIGTEYGDTSYHTVVTVFEPDVERNGMEFDYAEELLSNPDNIELEIKRRQSERSATGEKHPNTSNELPSKYRISAENGNVKYSMSDSSEDIGPVRGDIYGSDVAVERTREIGPVMGNTTPNASNATPNTSNATANASFEDGIGPVVDPAAARVELRDLRRQMNALERRMEKAFFTGDWDSYIQDARWYEALSGRVNFLQRSLPESRMRHRETV